MKKINEYLKITEAAKFLGVSTSTLRNWEKQGKLLTYRNPHNKYRLYKINDLKNLLAKINDSNS